MQRLYEELKGFHIPKEEIKSSRTCLDRRKKDERRYAS